MLLPSTHDATQLIEVVRITDPMRHLSSEDLVGDGVAFWEGEQAQEALDLIVGLPGGEKQRCFIPGWGIRAHRPTDLVLEVAFCFRCNGARLWGPGVSAGLRWQTFDAESPSALELLRRFRACGAVRTGHGLSRFWKRGRSA